MKVRPAIGNMYLSFVVVKEYLLHYALLYVGTGIAVAGQTMARLFS